MKAVRVTEEWQRAGVHYVRTQARHYGQAGIIVAENWMREKGLTKIYINSRKAALGFYEKLGYTADFSQVSGSGEFECVMTEKELA